MLQKDQSQCPDVSRVPAWRKVGVSSAGETAQFPASKAACSQDDSFPSGAFRGLLGAQFSYCCYSGAHHYLPKKHQETDLSPGTFWKSQSSTISSDCLVILDARISLHVMLPLVLCDTNVECNQTSLYKIP